MSFEGDVVAARPRGSRVEVEKLDSGLVIRIPQGKPVVEHYLVATATGGMAVGLSGLLAATVFPMIPKGGFTSGAVAFLVLWPITIILCLLYTYRVFRKPVPETWQLTDEGIIFDPGIPPMQLPLTSTARLSLDARQTLFPGRKVLSIRKDDLQSLRLRQGDSSNRLTVDSGSDRINLASTASDIEREWLGRLLVARYGLAVPN